MRGWWTRRSLLLRRRNFCESNCFLCFVDLDRVQLYLATWSSVLSLIMAVSSLGYYFHSQHTVTRVTLLYICNFIHRTGAALFHEYKSVNRSVPLVLRRSDEQGWLTAR